MIIYGETDKEGDVELRNTGRTNADGTTELIKINPFDIGFSSTYQDMAYEI